MNDPALHTRNVSGFANNLTLGRAFWGNADQPFLRLAPDQFDARTQTSPNAVRVTSVDGQTRLPNPRLVSDVIGQQALDADGNTISTPNPYGDNLFLMSFGQFFDHGLDFYARGGGSDLVPIADMKEQLAAAQARLNQIRAGEGLPPVQLDLTDNLLAQLQSAPQGFEFLVGSRAGRFDVLANGSVATNADGVPITDNDTGTAHLNSTAPFVEQSQTFGSAPEITYLLRESARDAAGNLIPDGHGGWVKTYRLLDGAPEVGPDGVARGSVPRYADILVNNGVSRDAINQVIADVTSGRMTNAEGWAELKSLSGFIDFGDLGPKHLILLGDKNDATASPAGKDGEPNPDFSLESLLSCDIAGDDRVNENVALTAVHTVWHREHNLQAERIKALHPEWSDEQIFQAAKMVQTAEYQRVVFTEFAEAMSGPIPGPSHGFSGYNPNVNPGISEEFAGAMYRVGHSMINETIPFTDAAGHTQNVPLFSAFLNPAMFDGKDPLTHGVGGAAAIIAGEVQTPHQRIDPQVVEVIRSHLLGVPLDLYSANIERGRDARHPDAEQIPRLCQPTWQPDPTGRPSLGLCHGPRRADPEPRAIRDMGGVRAASSRHARGTGRTAVALQGRLWRGRHPRQRRRPVCGRPRRGAGRQEPDGLDFHLDLPRAAGPAPGRRPILLLQPAQGCAAAPGRYRVPTFCRYRHAEYRARSSALRHIQDVRAGRPRTGRAEPRLQRASRDADKALVVVGNAHPMSSPAPKATTRFMARMGTTR